MSEGEGTDIHTSISDCVTFPDDMRMFLYQCSLATTMVLCLLFGGSTWFCTSKNAKVDFRMRIFIVVALYTMFIFGLVTVVLFAMQYFEEYIYGIYDRDIFYIVDYIALYIAIILGFIVLILVLIVSIALTVAVCQIAIKEKKNRTQN
ncbi:uncharacterized protein Lgt isoform X2 [Zeugodacus cucurbitae]|uniref:uncharacterized protein Lgt isoform X2 n=1 Tax=Zeugodacus cucurbitae TaxID=28588 RepID=UPI0005968562|nr:uncharacterized protein Lgt isoform X2 [Zeugodacus cucurbitae]XP_011181632.1 uncharacterized protein Lgt isoform X2 [Zeugodacus cucurbitae]XP_054087443.1 uncharacterized protein Lgt isoform X2 [Zeugodacus cucurbitae]